MLWLWLPILPALICWMVRPMPRARTQIDRELPVWAGLVVFGALLVALTVPPISGPVLAMVARDGSVVFLGAALTVVVVSISALILGGPRRVRTGSG